MIFIAEQAEMFTGKHQHAFQLESDLGESKIACTDFFIESTCTDGVRAFKRLCMPCLDVARYNYIALNKIAYNTFTAVL